ncbi:MAG: pirin family protein [Candidatus Eremiobacteraeota bacterium]|nr:pirin family protein [Candidatus Eremiobacteraeota bacterium]
MNPTVSAEPVFSIQRSANRFDADHGWLHAKHSFSFADYYDPANESWGALRVLNEDRIAAGQGFPPHPHRDMEIITYVFSGHLEHRDSMGNHGIVGPGGVQFISAGTGVRHAEFNASQTEELHLAQMWLVPGRVGAAPSYGQVDFTLADRSNGWLVVASGEKDVVAPIALTQNATMRVAKLEQAALAHAFNPERYGFLFVAHGDVVVNGESLHAGDAVRTFAIDNLAIEGTGELILWDTSAL